MQLLDDILITGSSVPAAPPARPLADVPLQVLLTELARRYPVMVFGGISPEGEPFTSINGPITGCSLLGGMIQARSVGMAFAT